MVGLLRKSLPIRYKKVLRKIIEAKGSNEGMAATMTNHASDQDEQANRASAPTSAPAQAPIEPAEGGPKRPERDDKVGRMGTASIPRLIVEFAIPSILGMLVNGAYNVIDSVFLGQAMGEIGLATATVAMPIMTVFMLSLIHI